MTIDAQIKQRPSAFYCSSSNQLMQNPVMHPYCARLFEASVAKQLPFCPHDKQPLDDLIAFNELKGRIDHVKPGSKQYAAAANHPLSTTLERLSITPAKRANPSILWEKNNVHFDDVHSVKLFAGGFVSGSKDGCVKLWDHKGNLTHPLYSSASIDYTQWVTALGSNSNVVISGTRNSWLNAWNKDGKAVNSKSFYFNPQADGGYKSKQRNQNRINCIEVFPQLQNGSTPFFIGGPANLHLLTMAPNGWFTICSSTKVHSNDWAYCVQPLSAQNPLGDLLVVVGAQINLFKRNLQKNPLTQSAWDSTKLVVQENMKERGSQIAYGKKQILRALIPSIERHPIKSNHLAYACFENNRGFGAIRIVDLETSSIIFDGQEHKGRSWDIAFPSSNVLASGADDHTIKLWDTRIEANSFYTLPKHIGRVSCLLSPQENVLLASSCPDNVKTTREKARFTLWDLRMAKEPAS